MNNENKSFSCVLCGFQLPSKEALQEHFRKHANKEIDTKGKPIPKPVSGNADKQNSDEITPEKETIDCDVCSMKFETVTQAIQHKFRKHPESSLKYYCPYCGMQFPLKVTRDKHVQNHQGMSNLGSFPCPDCGVIFHNMGAQSYHVKSTHKRIMSIFKPVPTPPPSKKIKINNANEAQSVYYCYLCGSEYIIKFNLQKHLERTHTQEERNNMPEDFIKCTTCDALFYNKKAYDTHNMYHRPDDLYVTSEEQRLQTVTRVDQDFDIRRVQLTADKFIPVDKPKQRRQTITRREDPKPSNKTVFKIDTDEELSPTSSIDSSDSDNEKEKINNEKAKTKMGKEKLNVGKEKMKIEKVKMKNEKVKIKNEKIKNEKIEKKELPIKEEKQETKSGDKDKTEVKQSAKTVKKVVKKGAKVKNIVKPKAAELNEGKDTDKRKRTTANSNKTVKKTKSSI